MPLAYPPPIVPTEFYDGRRLAMGRNRGTATVPDTGIKPCPLRRPPPIPRTPPLLCAITSVTIAAGGKTSVSYSTADHENIPSADGGRVNFAPKLESGRIDWVVENVGVATGGKLEVFRRGRSAPLFTKALTQGELASGTFTYDGRTAPSRLFPGGFLNVEHGPYKVKVTVQGPTRQGFEQAFTYVDVVIKSITLEWGKYTELPKDRLDIHVDHLPTILGDVVKRTKGYEEEALDHVVATNPAPGEGLNHSVVLKSNIFAKKKQGDMEIEEYTNRTDFELYRDLWGKGARIPIHAKVLVKKADGSGTDLCPEALEGCKLQWDWQDSNLKRWREGLTPTAKTEDFLRDIFSQNEMASPKNVANCPQALGGKLGDSDSPIFRPSDGNGPFPYVVEPCRGRSWAAFSYFPKTGSPAARCRSGAIFWPSRIAGDRYPVSVSLYFDPSMDTADDIVVPKDAKAVAGTFEVFKKTTLHYLVRGGPAELGCDPASIEAAIRERYLKECKTIIDVRQAAIDNDVYKRALVQAAAAVEKKPNAYTQFQIMPLFTRYMIDYDPPANSPGIRLKTKAQFIAKLDQVVEAGRFRMVGVAGMLEGEEIVGGVSGTKGIPLTCGKTKADVPVPVLIAAGQELTNGEIVKGQASQVDARASIRPGKNCWGHTFTDATGVGSRYDTGIEVVAGGVTALITYAKTGIKRTLSTVVSESGARELESWLGRIGGTHNESQPLAITIRHKGKDSEHHRERIENLKKAIDDLLTAGKGMLDRKAVWESFKKSWATLYDDVTYRQMFQKNFAVSWLIQAVVESYVALKHAADQGIFLLHIPGRTNVAEIDELKVKFADLRVAGAFYGDAFYTDRAKTATYVATLPLDTPGLYKEECKSIESIFVHEAGHAIFLPHATRVNPKAPDPAAHKEGCHVKGDNCLMNYDVDSEHFCGLCMLRLRGWDWTPLPNSLGEQEYLVHLEMDDVDTLFSEGPTSRRGIAERLQVMGLLNRPFDHPEFDACYDFSWSHYKDLFPQLEGASATLVRNHFKREVEEFLMEGRHLPGVGHFAKIRVPGGYSVAYSQNYLEGTIPPADQGKPAAKPYEAFMLGANRGKAEEMFYAANPSLGKIPLKATVWRRPKGSDEAWGNCPLAPGAKVYFELVPPDDVAAAPAPMAGGFHWVAGGKCYYKKTSPVALKGAPGAYLTSKVDGFKPTGGPDSKNVHKDLGGKRGAPVFARPLDEGFAEVPFDSKFPYAGVATADDEGVARIVFAPSRVGGDTYRLRAFVGPVTQDKKPSDLAKGGDDVVETGTMVRWRTVRICQDIVMSPAADDTEAPADACKKGDGALMPNVDQYFGPLPALDFAGALTSEMAKAYCELVIEPAAEASIAVSLFGDEIKATAIDLARRFPKFNSTLHSKGSIHKEPMTAVPGSNDRRFQATLATLPEKTTVSVRPRGGDPDSALANDKDGIYQATPKGVAVLTGASLTYNTGVISIEFEDPQPGKTFDACYHPAAYVDIDALLDFPDTSPFLFNLALPRVYNANKGAGYKAADANPLDETARPTAFHAFIDAQTLGLCKALLLDATVRGVNRNGGYYPGLLFFRAHRVDNYTAIWPTGTQEGKGVGNGIFLFDVAGASNPARFAALTLHEMSHGLFLMHAPTAPGNRPEQHDPADQYCVMSYDPNDGDHCGQCVAVLRGMNTAGAPFR